MRTSGLLLSALLIVTAACSGKKAKVAEGSVVGLTAEVVPPAPVAPVAEEKPTESNAPRRERERPRLKLSLRSTPPGAKALVDGRPVGSTPLIHELEDDGRAHEFTFVLEGYAMERYKFPPIQDGVIHAKLKPIPASADAGATARR